MIINHNISALNTYRQLSFNNSNSSRSIEKLSSGYRINRAGDDAAGLAISEKMRGQIRGLDMASRNAQDGISLIQTAEGALNETHSILQRMRELAVQSASDTNTTVDRSELQKEVDQLSQELSRIGSTTEFNTQALLDGTFSGIFQIGANEGQTLGISIEDMRGFILGVAGSATVEVEAADGGEVVVAGTYVGAGGTPEPANSIVEGTYNVVQNEGGNYELRNTDNNTLVATSTDGGVTFKGHGESEGDPATETLTFDAPVTSGTVTVSDGGGTVTATYTAAGTEAGTETLTNNGLEAGEYKASGDDLLDASGNVVATFEGDGYKNADGEVVLASEEALENGTAVTVGGIDVSSQTSAGEAITKIETAIGKVSAERSKLGAYQNRLDHTINNLGTSSENLTAAESRIRDVDMAKEIMEFTKNNILQQAAQAMLAQANAQPQGVLQLLR